MAITKKQRDFNYQVVIKGLKHRENEVKNYLNVNTLLDISNASSTAKKNEMIKEYVSRRIGLFRDSMNAEMDDNIRIMVRKVIKDQGAIISRQGIKITGNIAQSIEDSFVKKYNKEQFLGLTRKQRLQRIISRQEKDLSKAINYLAKIKDPKERKAKAQQIIDTLRGTKRGYASDKGKYNSFSLSRSTDRLIASETGRSQRKVVEYLGKEIGIGYVKWVMVGDKKTCPVCRMLATTEFVPYKELPIANRAGVFRIGEVPNSHPFCRCKLNLVQFSAARKDPDKINPEMSDKKRLIFDQWKEQQAIVARLDEKLYAIKNEIMNVRTYNKPLSAEDKARVEKLQKQYRENMDRKNAAVKKRAELRTEYNSMKEV